MPDPRLDSVHLEFPRRQGYRHARQALLDARGLLTMAGAYAERLAGGPDDWPSDVLPRPGELLPGTRFLLVERARQFVYPLRIGLNTVGRFPDNDVVLEDSWVSRRHCVFLVHARGECELHDTASRNGTSVNGRRVGGPRRLQSGDRVTICGRVLEFVSAEEYLAGPAGDEYPATDPG
jgi:FHA domain